MFHIIGSKAQIAAITEDCAEKILLALREDSATGPHGLPTKIIEECAAALAGPFVILARIIIREGRWPEL